jgi:hypothetical protein
VLSPVVPSAVDITGAAGAVVSTVQSNIAVDSRFPAASVDRILRLYAPSANEEYNFGLVHVEYAARFKLHSELAMLLPVPSAVNVKVIEFDDVVPPDITGLLFPSIADTIVVTGTTVSIVNDVEYFKTLLLTLSATQTFA